MRDRDPEHLHPLASAKMAQLLSLTQPAGLPVALAETWRDPGTQDADYAKGRDSHGNIVTQAAVVTQARGGQSWHNLTRWVRRCEDCGHDPAEHGPLGDSDPGFRSCLSCLRRCLGRNVGAWLLVPASLAWHFYLRDDGDEAPGSLEGIGANTLSPADKARYWQLGKLAQSIGLRWGGDFDGDGIAYERGEWDLGHFEARPPGATLSHVQAVLAIKGGDLVLDRGGLRT